MQHLHLEVTHVKSPRPQNFPVYISARDVAAVLGVSLRRVQQLRQEPWFPQAVMLGPRQLRWNRDELIAAVAKRAPRVQRFDEPDQLRASRERED